MCAMSIYFVGSFAVLVSMKCKKQLKSEKQIREKSSLQSEQFSHQTSLRCFEMFAGKNVSNFFSSAHIKKTLLDFLLICVGITFMMYV